MEYHLADINSIVINLQATLNLKTEAELAEKLGMTKNAFSMLKKRNSVGTLIERLLELPESDRISLDYLLADKKQSNKIFLLCKKIYINFDDKEIVQIEMDLDNAIDDQANIQQLLGKFKTLKGATLASKFAEMVHGRGERMSVILYKFLQHIIGKVLLPVEKEYAKSNFLNALKSFELRGLHGFLFSEKDKNNLLVWLEQELDDDDYYMILSDIAGMADKLKPLLNIVNRPIV